MNVSEEKERDAIRFARQLVEDHVDADEPARDRLWRVARQVGVEKIEPRSTNALGYLARLDNGKFAIYYSQGEGCQKVRTNFTIAHELAHLVLQKFVPHIDTSVPVTRSGNSHSNLERTVERIAAELVMPAKLVSRLLQHSCDRELQNVSTIPRLRIIRDLCSRLEVSEQAMVFRLLELPDLLSVLIRVCLADAPAKRKGAIIPRRSQHGGVRIAQSLHAIKLEIDKDSNQSRTFALSIDSEHGPRRIKCDGWKRPVWTSDGRHHEFWVVGWTWNLPTIQEFDDAS